MHMYVHVCICIPPPLQCVYVCALGCMCVCIYYCGREDSECSAQSSDQSLVRVKGAGRTHWHLPFEVHQASCGSIVKGLKRWLSQ